MKEPKAKTIITHTQFLGSIEYYALHLNGTTVWEAHENYQKRSSRNQCKIKTNVGTSTFSIPLQKGKTKSQIQQVKISYEENWPREFTNMLWTNYAGSPYYQYYIDRLQECWIKRPKMLWELNISLHKKILKILELDENQAFTKEWIKDYGQDVNDFRQKKLTIRESYWYPQVFEERGEFAKNLSIIDLIFCCGPESLNYLRKLQFQFTEEH